MISDEIRAEALAHAMREMPLEACGLVVIVKGKARYFPCRNISPYKNTFELSPEDYATAEDLGDIVRVIHSHCYQSPNPSEPDLVACEQLGIPWSIVSVPNGFWVDFEPKGYRAPLIGRQWSHANLDCYALIRDFYREKLGVELIDFDRDDQWWHKGGNLYMDCFPSAGFQLVPMSEIKPNDLILMQLASPVINHGAIYLGNDMMLHHMHRRLSCREVWGGYYRKHSLKVLRHESQCGQ